jgi:hypothetical protein
MTKAGRRVPHDSQNPRNWKSQDLPFENLEQLFASGANEKTEMGQLGCELLLLSLGANASSWGDEQPRF